MRKSWLFILVTFAMAWTSLVYAGEKTTTGFYWPLKTDIYLFGAGSWLGTVPGYSGYHLAVDMWKKADNQGETVYSIADGIITGITRNGWGNGNIGIFVQHKLTDGRLFKALYGHIKEDTAMTSGTIKAGNEIGVTGLSTGPIHIHFGIVEPEKEPVADPGYAYSSDKSDTHNFIDPVNFLKTHTPENWISNSAASLPYRRVSNVAWYPPNESCVNAERWRFYSLGYPNGGMSIGSNYICYQEEQNMMLELGGLGSNWWEIIYGLKDLNELGVCRQK